MLRVYEGTKRLALPFGVMICKLLIEQVCQAYDYEEPILLTKKINVITTLNMFETHTRGHIQGENIQAQATEVEHSVEDHLLAVKEAVYDQSIQIELLEERVTAGFFEMRRTSTEQINEMRHMSTEQYNQLSNELSTMFDQLRHR